MEKKGNRKATGGDKGGGLHRHSSAHNQGNFPRSSSFSGQFSPLHEGEPLEKVSDPKSKKAIPMRRPNTHPELLNRDKSASERTPWLNLESPPHFTKKEAPAELANSKSSAKLLVNVTVAQSSGSLRVLLSNDATVLDVIKAAVAVYAKEGRRAIINSDPLSFGLHYSQFSIDCLNPNDKIKDLGSRNFFMFPRKETITISCATEMEKLSRVSEPWYKIMDCFRLLP